MGFGGVLSQQTVAVKSCLLQLKIHVPNVSNGRAAVPAKQESINWSDSVVLTPCVTYVIVIESTSIHQFVSS